MLSSPEDSETQTGQKRSQLMYKPDTQPVVIIYDAHFQ